MEVENDVATAAGPNHKPRPYQNQILEVALSRNVIIYLPTGSGKTYIAIMAINEMSRPLQKRFGEGGKRAVFLVNTVALARQQFESIRSLVNLKVRLYTGDMNVDNWKREKWREEFEEHQVFIATAQIILDVIRHGFVSITDFNLMIFDECHHAANDHPMKQLMGHFQNQPAEQLPRVIGLTGLLLKSSSPETIESDLNKLESVFRATIVTAASQDDYQNVLLFSTKPKETTIRYSTFPPQQSIYPKITALSNLCLSKVTRWDIDTLKLKPTKNFQGYAAANPIKKHKNYVVDFLQKVEDMGIYGASIAILSIMVEFELSKRAAETQVIRNLSRVCISYAERMRHELVHYMKSHDDFDDDDMNEIHEMIYVNSTQKIQALLGYLVSTFNGKDPKDISCLVFVERRQTAKCLYYLIKHFVESKGNVPIVPEFMVGQRRAMPESIETWLDSKRQRNVLRKFKKGDCNMVVASSVLEEGIDVQSCNYVIIYDRLKHFGAYVQTKGRARMANSTYTIMIESSEMPKVCAKILKWNKLEENLRKYLVGKTVDRMLPLQEEINEQFTVNIQPFCTKLGAMLEASSVVQLLNRYCMSLPQDSFTSSMPVWSKVNTEGTKIMVRLVMPPQSTIKQDILSDPMDSVKMAKQSAAMKACIQLYKNRELNEHLLPISKVNCFEHVEDIYFKHWDEFKTDIPRLAGTGKCRRLHDIQYPDQLTNARPTVGTVAFLYNIQITPTFPKATENEWMVKLLSTSSSFALLTSKEIPRLAKMPLFLSQGQVICELSAAPVSIVLSSNDQLELMNRFHVTLFRDILDTWNSFFTLNLSCKENSFYIVPTKNGTDIDWELIRRCQGMQKPRELSEAQRKKMTFDPADYENSVVCPWYSVDTSTRYVVLRVVAEMSPFSSFPNEEYSSYAAYVQEKYSRNTVVRNQFLLHVQPITSRRNTIHPGEGVSGSRSKGRRFNDIYLIPELCHNFKFPGDLWMKATFLPCVLHRIRYLLLADGVRVSINQFLGIDHSNHVPNTLPVDKIEPKEDSEEDENSIDDDRESSHSPKKVAHRIEKTEVTDIMDGQRKWSEHEEPEDIDRKLDELYEVELDYYMQFVETAMHSLKLDERGLGMNVIVSPAKQLKREAICGEPGSDAEIKLLRNHSYINQAEMLVAITRKSTADVFNMERLELLGDSFLKFAASFYIFDRHMNWNEGCLTALKGRMVSNRNLFYLSNRLDLPGKINVEKFEPRNEWQPPLVSVPPRVQQAVQSSDVSPFVLYRLNLSDEEVYKGDVTDENLQLFMNRFSQEEPCADSSLVNFFGKRMIGDKCCSDTMEAILGVCIKNLGVERSFKMLNYFGICPKDDSKDISRLIEKVSYKPRVNPTTDSEIDFYLPNYHQIEAVLGYQFRDRGYLLQALTHPSYVPNRATGCYQVLEFIGDAVLDFLVSSYIFERCEHMGPGELTDLRSALVNNAFLACLTVKYKFHLHLLNQSATLMKAIEHFVRFQEGKGNIISDQVRILVEEKDCAIADYIEVPKALGDIFESIIGAVLLDSGNNLERTWNVIYNLMSEEIASYAQKVPKQLVRLLTENKGANAKFMPPVVDEDVVMVACQFTCRGQLCEVNGFGSNKESARVSAAKLALQALAK